MERSGETRARRRARTRGRRVAVGALAAVAVALTPAVASATESCPSSVDPTTFASEATLKRWNAKEASYGPRPTASPSQAAFVSWLERKMDAIPGVETSSLPYEVDRWTSGPSELQVGALDVRVAGPVPYAGTTGASGVTAPLVYLPDGQSITAANAAGKIVVRDLPTTSLPNLFFYAPIFGYSMYDPDHSIDLLGSFKAEGIAQSAVDLQAADAAGAKGVIAISQLPDEQFRGSFAPYEGLPLALPGAYLGADEGAQVKAAIAAQPGVQATLHQETSSTPTPTRTLLATIPGGSAKKIVVESHTDGMSALWDNGPIAMIAMARHLAALPVECRPETIQFAFVTGHLKQHLVSDTVRDGGAGQLAEQLDVEYEQGLVKGVVVLEHLGAKEYEPVARPGHPGGELRPTGKSQMLWVPVTDSTKLRDMVTEEVREHDLRRTAVLKGLDVADLGRVPHMCSFGGEGTPYNRHLIPTVAPIAAPRTLFSPQFGVETIDFGLMRRQSLAFTDVVTRMSAMSQADVAGDITFQRQQRASGAPGCA